MPLGPGLAGGAILDFGLDAAFDDREDDVMEDPALTVDGIDSREITAAGRTGRDRDCVHNGGLAQGGAGGWPRGRPCAAAGAARRAVPVHL